MKKRKMKMRSLVMRSKSVSFAFLTDGLIYSNRKGASLSLPRLVPRGESESDEEEEDDDDDEKEDHEE